MSEFIDITLPLDARLPIWPGSSAFKLAHVARLEADGYNETRFSMGSHTGTHIDAPRHFVEDGATVEQLPLMTLVGPAWVVDLGTVPAVTASVLSKLVLPDKLDRLLLKTVNSQCWAQGENPFREDFVALTRDGAEWLANRGVRLVGIDYLSVQRFQDTSDTHIILLNAGTVLLEGLNLAAVNPGGYELICLPLPIVGGEGAPARVVLRSITAQPLKENTFEE